MQVQSVERTHVGNVRLRNEDAVLTIPEQNLFVVADGMGGERAGAEASEQAIRTIQRVTQRFFAAGEPDGPALLSSALIDALDKANYEVFDISVQNPEKSGLGSTASVLCLHRGMFFVAHVGDSRVYLLRGGEVRQLTRDHTVVWPLYEEGIISRDQLETHPERHLLTQCIGLPKPLEVQTVSGIAQPNDLFLICTDGLTAYAGDEVVNHLLREFSLDLEPCADALVQAALDGGGGDNVSLILVRVEAVGPADSWRPAPPPPPPRPAIDHRADTVVEMPAAPPQRSLTASAARILGLLGLVFLAGLAAFTFLYPRRITVEIRLDAVADDPSTRIEVLQLDGQPLPDALGPRDGAFVRLNLPRQGDYILRIRGATIEDFEEQVYFSAYDPNAYPINTIPRLEPEEEGVEPSPGRAAAPPAGAAP